MYMKYRYFTMVPAITNLSFYEYKQVFVQPLTESRPTTEAKRPVLCWDRKEGNVLLTTHSTHFIYGYMASDMLKEGRKEVFYLTMHSTHFIYGYMASDIW